MNQNLFRPDYNIIICAANNQKPQRLPLYEHYISPKIMERILGTKFEHLDQGGESDVNEFIGQVCNFYKQMTYDTISYEVCVTPALPGTGALMGQKPGPIQSRKDFEEYPWHELGQRYWTIAHKRFSALTRQMPEGMKAIGGIGNGVFEISEDLVGLEYLAYMQMDDPCLFADVYKKIGDLLVALWKRFLAEFGQTYAVCRFGDDLGFRSGPLTSPLNIRTHVLPQYKRIIDLIRAQNKPFLWHSCGCIFQIMDDVIALGINAKHSNEDAIAPFDKWVTQYGQKIALFGGIDVDVLCQMAPSQIEEKTICDATRFRQTANGFALGSGNSIPEYVPIDGYLAMIRAAQKIREQDDRK